MNTLSQHNQLKSRSLSLSKGRLALLLSLLLVSGLAMGQRNTGGSGSGSDPGVQHVTIGGSVFGGGNLAAVAHHSSVIINQQGATIAKDVYGGGAKADVNTLNTTDTTGVTLTQGIITGDVFGGGLGDLVSLGGDHSDIEAWVNGSVTVVVNGGIARNVYGCNNLNGAPKSDVEVYIEGGTVDTVFGGGKLASTPNNVSPIVNINGGTVNHEVYGGGALADVGGTTVNVMGGEVKGDIYGGGLGRKAADAVTDPDDPTIILEPAVEPIPAAVNGVVHVYIGAAPVSPATEPSGSATIGGSVYGCNNLNGSPKDDVYVDVYRTAHVDSPINNYYPPDNEVSLEELNVENPEDADYAKKFAIKAVYGGGNQAHYIPTSEKTTQVHIHYCTENTVQTVYGGGNAADVGSTGTGGVTAHTHLIVDGGRFDRIFGGGNGYSQTGNHNDPSAPYYNPGANISGTATTDIYGGLYRQVFGGSNQWGNVNSMSLSLDMTCDTLLIYESFGGGNEAVINGDVTTTLGCSDFMIGTFYGGSNLADINGDVTLNVQGGHYENVFGGSKGRLESSTVSEKAANINGNVTLNLYGGTMINAFGGNDVLGRIRDTITVNVLHDADLCSSFRVDTIYGGGRDAAYAPDSIPVTKQKIVSPVVNLWHGTVGEENESHEVTVPGCVFGGGKGATAVVTANPKVNIGDIEHTGNNNQIKILGHVFGGGNAAAVDGIDSVLVLKANSRVVNLYGGGNEAYADSAVVMMNVNAEVDTIFGGGNMAGLGDPVNHTGGYALITVSDGTVKGGVYGGSDRSGTIYGDIHVNVTGGTLGANNRRANIHGGGYGYETASTGDVTVNFGAENASHLNTPALYGDLYGGSGFGNVNASTSNSTTVNIINGEITGDVYGGGLGSTSPNYAAAVNGNVTVNIGKEIENTLYNHALFHTYGTEEADGGNVFGCNNANGAPQGTVTVNVNGNVAQNVFGGGNEAAYTYSGNYPAVNIFNGAVAGSVFGGGKGGTAIVTGRPTVVVGDNAHVNTATVGANVYGGGDLAKVVGSTLVTIQKNSGDDDNTSVAGSVYGGGNEANVSGSTEVNVTGGTITNDVYGGGALAHVNITGEGGSASHTPNANTTVSLTGGTVLKKVFGGGMGDGSTAALVYGNTTVTVDGTVINGDGINTLGDVIGGVFGGCNVNGTVLGNATVEIDSIVGTAVNHVNVYGGGLGANTNVQGSVMVTIDAPYSTLYGDVYGGSAKGLVNYTYGSTSDPTTGNDIATTVTLTNGTVTGDIYGGGHGLDSQPANVGRGVVVNVNGGSVNGYGVNNANGGNVFGCNNAAGAPRDTVRVNINSNVANNVYGGGNLASYSYSGDVKSPLVTVNNGTMNNVYGGGLGASAKVLSNPKVVFGNTASGNTALATNVYGGGSAAEVGNSEGTPNININNTEVLFQANGTAAKVFGGGMEAGVTGTATVTIAGGAVTAGVYGGCDNSGTVGGNITVDLNGGTVGTDDDNRADVYGGGFGGDPNPDDSTPEGTFTSGNVTVTLQGTEVYGDLYGGSAFGSVNGNSSTTKVYVQDNKLHGKVFGGGKGQLQVGSNPAYKATTNGNVEVNIETANTNGNLKNIYGGANVKGNVAGNINVNVNANVGADGNGVDVFGGGLGANTTTQGNVTVTVDKLNNEAAAPVVYGSVYGGSALGGVNTNTDNLTKVDLKNGTVNGTIYGGGMGDASTSALVSGDIEVAVGDGTTTTKGVYGGCNVNGTVVGGTTVGINGAVSPKETTAGAVYGGGLGENTVVNGSVAVNVGLGSTVNGDVYGGSAKGLVNCTADFTTTPATITPSTSDTTGVTLSAGAVNGNIYGGGHGLEGKEADVYGPVTVLAKGGTVNNVYGANNLKGSPQSTVVVNVESGVLVNNDVFGGGNQANYIGGSPVVNIKGGTVKQNVFGGGNEAGVGAANHTTTVNIISGSVGSGDNLYGIYGGCNTSGTVTGAILVNVTGGTLGTGASNKLKGVFGGGYGYQTATTGNVDVTVNGATVWGDVYGGSAEGNVNDDAGDETRVTLTSGTIHGDLYGGGLGTVGANAHAALVNGAVKVIVNSGTVTGSVYGCNNANGAPQSTVHVDIYDTDHPAEGHAIANVYGGGNQAAYSATGQRPHVTIHDCGSRIGNVFGSGNKAMVPGTDVTVYGGIIADVYGGGNNAGVSTTAGTAVKIHGGTINRVFAGNNEDGNIPVNSSMSVTVNKEYEEGHSACELHVTELYGGGNAVAGPAGTLTVQCTGGNTEGIGKVFGGANAANITSDISLILSQGRITEGIYGGNNSSGTVNGNIAVTLGGAATCDVPFPTVYGGGYGADTHTNGNVTVTVGTTTATDNQPTLSADVYGGSAFGSVNDALADKTTVNIYGGTVNGNVYGGGLGEANNAEKGKVNGEVTVNIGTGTVDSSTGFSTSVSGNASFGATSSVYGGNNTGGSPQGDVTVNVYATAHTNANQYENGTEYAIANVFGGGNKANYAPEDGSSTTTKKARVNIYDCYNTIGRTFGGGNAAAAPSVETMIQGGRIGQVFGGGNGEVTSANINGDVDLGIHGGLVGQFFGGSNNSGNISGEITIIVDNTSGCGNLEIDEFFCGGNYADIIGGLETTIECSPSSMVINNLYGGCNMADIYGDVVLNLKGGQYVNVFGGSKGRLANPSANPQIAEKAANIKQYPSDWETNTSYPAALATYMNAHGGNDLVGTGGNVTLNLLGGTMVNAYGGNNVLGNIEGVITVNLLDTVVHCTLQVDTIYGSGCDAYYTPKDIAAGVKPVSPLVNLLHGTVGHEGTLGDPDVAGCVFGGGKGTSATVTANPKVTVGDGDSGHNVTVRGNVFGGGNAAAVTGVDTVLMQKGTVMNDIYGGGNRASVSGSTTVNITGGTVTRDIYGGGALADVGTSDSDNTVVNITSGTVVGNIYGGGLGSREPGNLVEAKVYGDVTVTVDGGTVANVFGCNNENGAPQNAVTVNINNNVTGNVYGGGNLASASVSPLVFVNNGSVNNVFGGGYGDPNDNTEATAMITGNPVVTVGDGTGTHSAIVTGNVYGGGNAAKVTGNTSVIYNDNNASSQVAKLFGGGNAAGVTGTAQVDMTLGKVTSGIYGGCNTKGNVEGDITVNVMDGTIGAEGTLANIHGGGYGQQTSTNGHVTVNFGNNPTTHNDFPKVYGDIYGGSALGWVNAGNDTTMVNVLNGTVYGDIYGGGLGDNSNPAKVNGKVYVNIGEKVGTTLQGEAAFSDTTMVFGCNNANGSPQDSVFVNIYSTHHGADPTTNAYPTGITTLAGLAENSHNQTYAIQAVYGGGNLASYKPLLNSGTPGTPKSATVHVYGCDINTIKEVYGGGNAADVGLATTKANTFVIIDGGRINRVFGGGKGDNTVSPSISANIHGTATSTINAGLIDTIFGGGNMRGNIDSISLVLAHVGTCTEVFNQVYGGANEAEIASNLNTTINCGVDRVGDIYGCSNLAQVDGNVTLNIRGGHFNNVFGGSKGAPGDGNGADITGNVELNLNGGEMVNAFGGSNVQGNIGGLITVNVLDTVTGCGLVVDTIYGAGQDAAYSPTNPSIVSPIVNLLKGTVGESSPAVAGCVFGGGKGSGAEVTANPKVVIGDMATGHENYQVEVLGNVFGGGNAAPVNGIDTILMQKSGTYGSQVVNLFGGGNKATAGSTVVVMTGGTVDTIFGGGNLAGLAGTARINMNEGTANKGIYGGCNVSGTVDGNVTVNINGGTVGADGATANVHGGGYGQNTKTGANVEVTIAKTGAVAPVIWGDVYGGSALGSVNSGGETPSVNTLHHTYVTLTDGTVNGDIYGGGLGDDVNNIEAKLWSPVLVTVNGGSVTGSVYGCNNLYGAPQSTVHVDINNSVSGSVFGGGNLAQYSGSPVVNINNGTVGGNVFGGGKGVLVSGANRGQKGKVTGNPQVTVGDSDGSHTVHVTNDVYGGGDAANVDGTPVVVVNDCNTTIGYLYGGGNAADVTGTNVTVNAVGSITEAYGGGHGDKTVIVEPLKYADVNGNVVFYVYGGTISKVFAGSNSKGSITGTSTLTVNKTGTCPMKIAEVYGGGNEAAGNAGTINIGCTGTLATLGTNEHYGIDHEGIQYVYGGANNADINNNIHVEIHSGIVENVFGGNNIDGTVNGTIQVDIDSTGTCGWYVGNVYGGGNQATYGTGNNYPVVNILSGLVSGDVFGGGLGVANNDTKGVVTGNPQVTANGAYARVNGSVYGGGSLAPTIGNPQVTLTNGSLTKVFGGGKAANVTGAPTVTITGGTVSTGVYGGCDSQGNVSGNITVNVNGGTIGSQANLNNLITADVYGGGYGPHTTTSKDVTVYFGVAPATSPGTPSDSPKIFGNVYGGSALGSVNTNSSDHTTVHILNGTLKSKITQDSNGFDVYNGGNVFGGGLGDSSYDTCGRVNGVVEVNIGAPARDGRTLDPEEDQNRGNASIEGNVYGCNNTNGSPKDSVTVNVYRTYRRTTDEIFVSGGDTTYAIANVFGGGNKADYVPLSTATHKKLKVMIHGCYNSVRRVFGGSNAAAAGVRGQAGPPAVEEILVEVCTNIDGGRFYQVFGGGNGEVSAANIFGDLDLQIHGGIVGQFYGASNQTGSISGDLNLLVDNSSNCESVEITEFFCGGNYADIHGNLETTITCSQGLNVTSIYGGCNQANIDGNVVLNLCGGTYTNVFGGSKGRKAGTNGSGDPGKPANITGNVTLNLFGGIIENVYGGSNINGDIDGRIIVNVIDDEGDCPLYITNIYGGSNETDYIPTYTPVAPETVRITPVVNVIHAKNGISGNVYGGSKGIAGAAVPTQVTANPLVNIGYDSSMSTYLSPTTTYDPTSYTRKTTIQGSVFGGGDAAKVNGNTEIQLKKGAKVIGNVYGGGNMGEVDGDTKVIINGKRQ